MYELMIKNQIIDISPARIIVFSFIILVTIGTLLLALPLSRLAPMSFIDLFFTATSATCVTGLFTIPLSNFTLFGKIIILLLIQIGSLSLASMSLLIISLFMDLGLGTRFMIEQIFELESWRNIKRILCFTLLSTFILEIIGALCFFSIFFYQYSFKNALFYAIFHSISSFSNAGISFFHFLSEQNLEIYRSNYLFLFTTTILTFLGGIGFITLLELIHRIRFYLFSHKHHNLSLHSKIIIYGSSTVVSVTALLFFILEYDNALNMLNFPLKIVNTLFHAISFKSCGFVLTSLTEFNAATLFLIMIVALIGSSPGSTGSGFKITTVVIFLGIIRSTIRGQWHTEIFERKIAIDQLYKVIAIIALGLGWILFTTFCLLITEKNWGFLALFFETISAFSNIGYSLVGSEQLSYIGKIFIIITMFIGRIGSLTFILSFKLKSKKEKPAFSYPEERVMLG